MNNKKSATKRSNNFNYDEALAVLGDENIKIVKNSKSTTLIEDKSGACIYIKYPNGNRIIIIQGLFKDDLLNNYTIAKATIDCNFELDSPYYQCHEIESGVRVAFVACSYHCG
jgi:hypothetical protein